ncbi:MAG: DedA family protein [Alphaproteobacteria bacterium]|nr:DedA family protein [Alphaproteobacteria bacterium]
MLTAAAHALVEVIKALGYPGVFILSALESTFLPIPSEATLIPAGYLIHQGEWNGPLVFLLAVSGTLAGSLANYWLAASLGRRVLIRYGRYFFMNEEKMAKMDAYFQRHGSASIFLGRLVFGVRHFISFPAGLAHMDLKLFSFYTALGGALWTFILLALGYFIGGNKELLMSLVPVLKLVFLAGVAVIGFLYWRKRSGRAPEA